MQPVKRLKPFNVNDYLLPLTSEEDIKVLRDSMNKTKFNEFMKQEKKKIKYNQWLNNQAVERCEETTKMDAYQKEMNRLNGLVNGMENKQIITLTGTFIEIEKQFKEYREKIAASRISRQQIKKESMDLVREANKKCKEFDRVTCILSMDMKIYNEKEHRNEREKKEAADPQWRQFLKTLNTLPNEILLIIQEYFTYETHTALLEKKYQPIKQFQSLNKKVLKNSIYQIYVKYYFDCKDDPVLKKELHDLWSLFYKDTQISEYPYHSATMKEMKLMIEYLFLLFRSYQRYEWCFQLYRMIIIMKNKGDH